MDPVVGNRRSRHRGESGAAVESGKAECVDMCLPLCKASHCKRSSLPWQRVGREDIQSVECCVIVLVSTLPLMMGPLRGGGHKPPSSRGASLHTHQSSLKPSRCAGGWRARPGGGAQCPPLSQHMRAHSADMPWMGGGDTSFVRHVGLVWNQWVAIPPPPLPSLHRLIHRCVTVSDALPCSGRWFVCTCRVLMKSMFVICFNWIKMIHHTLYICLHRCPRCFPSIRGRRYADMPVYVSWKSNT